MDTCKQLLYDGTIPLAHGVLFGMTNSGKTTLVNKLLANGMFDRYDRLTWLSGTKMMSTNEKNQIARNWKRGKRNLNSAEENREKPVTVNVINDDDTLASLFEYWTSEKYSGDVQNESMLLVLDDMLEKIKKPKNNFGQFLMTCRKNNIFVLSLLQTNHLRNQSMSEVMSQSRYYIFLKSAHTARWINETVTEKDVKSVLSKIYQSCVRTHEYGNLYYDSSRVDKVGGVRSDVANPDEQFVFRLYPDSRSRLNFQLMHGVRAHDMEGVWYRVQTVAPLSVPDNEHKNIKIPLYMQ